MATVASLVIQIGADMADLKRNAEKSVQVLKDLESKADQNAMSFGKLTGAWITAEATLGLLKRAGTAALQFISESIEQAAEAERAQKRLTVALQAQGVAMPSVLKHYDDLAQKYSKITVHADETIRELQVLLTQVGRVMPSQMDKAIKATTDLASGLGIDLETAARMVGKAVEGNVTSLRKLIPTIDESRVQGEGLEYILDQIEKRFGGQAQAEMQTYAGQVKNLGNIYNELKEQVGKVVLDSGVLHIAIAKLKADFLLLEKIVKDTTQAVSDFASAAVSGAKMVASPVQTATGWFSRQQAAVIAATTATTAHTGATQDSIGAADALMRKKLEEEAALEKAKASAEQAAKAQEQLRKQVQALADVYSGTKLADDVRKTNEAFRQAAAAGKDLNYQAVIKDVKALVDRGGLPLLSDELHELYLREVATKEITDLVTTSTKNLAAILGGDLVTGIKKAGDAQGLFNDRLRDMNALVGKGAAAGPQVDPFRMFTFADLGKAPDKTASQNIFSRLPETVLSTFTGGGQLGRAVGSMVGGEIAKGLADSLKKKAGETASGFLKSTINLIPGLGALAGGAVSLIGKLFGPSKTQLAGREATAKLDELQAKLVGPNGLYKSMFDLEKAAKSVGMTFQDIWTRKGVDGLKLFEDRLKAFNASLDEQAQAQEKLTRAIQKYGFTVEELGPVWRQQKLTEQAQALIEDFTVLTASGIETETVLTKMAGAVNEFLQIATRTGTDVPRQMRPMLEKMLDMGLLVSETGEALTDLSGLTFAETLSQGFDRVIAKLDELIRRLTNDLPRAISGLPDVQTGIGGLPDVMPRGSIRAELSGVRGGSEVPRESGTTVVNLQLDGQTIARATVPHIPGVVQGFGLS